MWLAAPVSLPESDTTEVAERRRGHSRIRACAHGSGEHCSANLRPGNATPLSESRGAACGLTFKRQHGGLGASTGTRLAITSVLDTQLSGGPTNCPRTRPRRSGLRTSSGRRCPLAQVGTTGFYDDAAFRGDCNAPHTLACPGFWYGDCLAVAVETGASTRSGTAVATVPADTDLAARSRGCGSPSAASIMPARPETGEVECPPSIQIPHCG